MPTLKASRIEEIYTNIDWERSHRMVRHSGLSSDHTSFLFLLKNDLLVTRERLFRIRKSPNPNCVFCGCTEGHTHIVECQHNTPVTGPLLSLLHHYMPSLSLERLVCFDWEVEGTASELTLLWVTAVSLTYLWERRKATKPIINRDFISELYAQWNIVKDTKYTNDATVMRETLHTFIPRLG